MSIDDRRSEEDEKKLGSSTGPSEVPPDEPVEDAAQAVEAAGYDVKEEFGR